MYFLYIFTYTTFDLFRSSTKSLRLVPVFAPLHRLLSGTRIRRPSTPSSPVVSRTHIDITHHRLFSFFAHLMTWVRVSAQAYSFYNLFSYYFSFKMIFSILPWLIFPLLRSSFARYFENGCETRSVMHTSAWMRITQPESPYTCQMFMHAKYKMCTIFSRLLI